MSKLTDKKRWVKRQGYGYLDSVLFDDLFHKYLEKSEGKICLEIGCSPGYWLPYIAREFGYFPEGIDYLDDAEEVTGQTFRNNNVNDYKIHIADFTTWEAPKKYDLVCSFGFIEHFTGDLNKQMVKKHVDLIKPGGKLIMDVPNFNYLQYPLNWLMNKGNLKGHNIRTMTLRYFRNIAKKYGLKILYLDYYGGVFDYWALKKNPNIFQKVLFCGVRFFAKYTRKIDIKNRFLSPYIVFIAEKER